MTGYKLRQALEVLQFPNLWFDLSSLVHNCRPDTYPYLKAIEFIRLAKEIVGSEKLMFGTDMPSALKEDVYELSLIHILYFQHHFFPERAERMELLRRTDGEPSDITA